MALKTKSFDIAEHLHTPEEIRIFLQEVAATGDEADFIHALNIAAKAMGMSEVAKKAGVTRASLGEDHFYILWYQPIDCEYFDDVKAMQSLMLDDIHFASVDKVEKNKWALVWRNTNSSTPHRTVKPHWLYIHEVFEDGVIDEGYEYPKCAFQRKDLEVPTPPFEITHDVSAAFKKAIQEKKIAKYLVQKDRDVFSLAYSLKGMPLLISRMKEYVANKANAADAKRPRG